MLELQGRLWLTEYVADAYTQDEKEMIYRVYVTEAIKHYLHMNMGYWELINGKNDEEEERSAEEIKLSFINRLGGNNEE